MGVMAHLKAIGPPIIQPGNVLLTILILPMGPSLRMLHQLQVTATGSFVDPLESFQMDSIHSA